MSRFVPIPRGYFEGGHPAKMGSWAWAVLTNMMASTGPTGLACPTIDDLAFETGLSRINAVRAMRRLEQLGYIRKVHGPTHRPNYLILAPPENS